MDFVRAILLTIEADPKCNGLEPCVYKTIDDRTMEETYYHLSRLIEAGYIEGKLSSPLTIVKGLTFQGHEYLNSIRDPKIWSLTKDGMAESGQFTFEVAKALAKGFIKKQIEQRTGVKLEF